MSRENVEVVRLVYEAVARRDTASVLALYDADIEIDSSRVPESELASGLIRGHEGLRQLFRDWSEAWESFEDDCEELIDAGEQVISVITRRGRGRASGAETTAPRVGVWTIREGKVIRVVWFPIREDALEAVGLSE
jgi:ketosteroid isomerase-like protein